MTPERPADSPPPAAPAAAAAAPRDRWGPQAYLMLALDEIGRIAVEELELADLARRMTALIKDSLYLDLVSLVLVEAQGRKLVFLGYAAEYEIGVRPGDTQSLDAGLVGLCAREGRTIYIEDVRADPHYVEVVPGIVEELAVPVRAGGRVVAVLNCETRTPGSLRDRSVFLEIAADRLGAALENAELLRDRQKALDGMRRYAQQMTILAEIARIATQDLELRPMLQRITDALAESFGWGFVACATVDYKANRFVCEAVTSRVETGVTVGYGRELGSGVVGEVAATGQPILLDDARTRANYVETMPGARSELCVPVKYGGTVIAVLNLESLEPAAFHDELPLLETVAEQVAGAIASARLYGETRRRADHLRMMSEVSRAAMEATDVHALLDRVLDYLYGRLSFSLVAVVLLDEKGEELELVSFKGNIPLNVSRGTRMPVWIGIVGRAVKTGETQLVTDLANDPDYVTINPDVVAELAVPIQFQGKTLGVVNFESTTRESFTPENVLVLRTFVDQIAGAVHMAEGNRRLADANRRLSELFSRYVAPDLAEALLKDPERFHTRGERREATVLFADIRGFTRLSQRLPSEKVLELLNEYYAEMAEAIFAERGSINRFLGDGFLAVFGVPERLADHAGAAVRAALEMQRRVETLSTRWVGATGEPLRVVVVANAGPVIAGSLGDPRHMEFTVLGDVVNVAARLEAEAKARDARILVSGDVYDALGGAVPARALGPVELRGREGAVRLYQVM
ncbi:MAG: GAF domain-containing protein [Planctomycetales bacterium]|nr:GAF domain-containing protein [Planctomycetales bacterium]